MFRVLDLEYQIGCLPPRSRPSHFKAQDIRPGDLKKDELAPLWQELVADWHQIDAIAISTRPTAPDIALISQIKSSFASELMQMAESPRWRDLLREGLDQDAALLGLSGEDNQKRGWLEWLGFRPRKRPTQTDDVPDNEFIPPPEAPTATRFSALDVEFPPSVRPTESALTEAGAMLARLEALIDPQHKTPLGPRVPTTSLPDLNGGAIRRLTKAGALWPEVLEKMLKDDKATLDKLNDIGVIGKQPNSEQGFTGDVWQPKDHLLNEDALSPEAARRIALQRREQLGPGTTRSTWMAAFEETVETWLRRIPDARLRSVRTYDLSADDAQAGVEIQLGVMAPGFLRLEIVALGISSFKLVVDWMPLDGKNPKAATDLLKQLKKTSTLAWAGSVLHLAHAWAGLAPMRPWQDLLKELDTPTADTLAELASHGAELRAAANAGNADCGVVITALPEVLASAAWPVSLEHAKQVFLSLSPAGGKLAPSLMTACHCLSSASNFTVSHLSDLVVLARCATHSGPGLEIAGEVCTLGGRFGCPAELARQLLDCLRTGGPPAPATQVLLGGLCQRVLSQARSHGMAPHEAISGPLRSLLVVCCPLRGLPDKLLESIAGHLREEAPFDLPQRWNPPADLRAEPWLKSLSSLANLSHELQSPRWSAHDLARIWGWLDSPDPQFLPKEAPGAFYLALTEWLLSAKPLTDPDLADLASHASRYQFLRALHATVPAVDERAAWIKAGATLVPWGGLGREWLFVCASASDPKEAARLWARGVELLSSWGRLGSTAPWLSDLGTALPWTKPGWRELVPAFVDDTSGGFPPRVADEVVKELYQVPHEQRGFWLHLLQPLLQSYDADGMAATIESGAASAVCTGTDKALLSAEGAISSLSHLLLSEDHQEQAERWRKLLPDDAAYISSRLPLRAAFLNSKIVKKPRQNLFLQRLGVFWGDLVSHLFTASDTTDFDDVWDLAAKAGATMKDLKRMASARLVNDIAALPAAQAAAALLRLLRVLPEAAPQVLDHATLLRSVLAWMLASGTAVKLWGALYSLLKADVPEGIALGLATDHLRAKGGVVTDDELLFLSALRPALGKKLPAIQGQVQGTLRDRLLATLLCTPDMQLGTAWRRQILEEYQAVLHTDTAAAARIAQLTPLLT